MSSSNSSDSGSSHISLSVDEQSDGTVNLILRAFGDGFCMIGSAYFDTTAVIDFLSELRRFPLGCDPAPFLSGGYLDDAGKVIVTETLHISVSQITKSGLLAMMIRVFSPDPEYWEKGFGHGGRCSYFLNYEDLKKFTDDFERLIGGKTSCFEFDRFTRI
ncbi:hypothetical protein [Tabrizicola sp.]|uniref:hypothetical protein n=1 Tax=Tabrizicola sp. TaxID=2005166 RepID=UPI00286A3102|nr:hypothetical protein [Tabrizicola sp.]